VSPAAAWRVRPLVAADLDAAHALLTRQGWAHRIGDAAAFAALVQASQRVVVAQADAAVIGFARALTDERANGYLSMVVVAPDFRGRGVGRALVEQLIGADDRLTWVLRAGREGAADFFAKLGFRASAVAMERRRGHEAGVAAAPGPVAAVMVHVSDVDAALAWYQSAFARAVPIHVAEPAFDGLALDGVNIEIVRADEKVSSGAAGSVVYWRVPALDAALAHLERLGATLYRGPMAIENGEAMCQVRDPWGNCIGLRGPYREEATP
jgi:ribosomal protein S18 acetylase RimI-like enzyme